jgi:hypothetical protein
MQFATLKLLMEMVKAPTKGPFVDALDKDMDKDEAWKSCFDFMTKILPATDVSLEEISAFLNSEEGAKIAELLSDEVDVISAVGQIYGPGWKSKLRRTLISMEKDTL